MNKDQFTIKPRAYNKQSYKYIFTPKHHERLAQFCAELLLERNESAEAHGVVAKLCVFLAADNNQFKRDAFWMSVNAKLIQLKIR